MEKEPLVTLDNFNKIYTKKLSNDLNSNDLCILSMKYRLSEGIVRYFGNRWDTGCWYNISKYQKLPYSIYRDYKDELCWRAIEFHNKYNTDFNTKFRLEFKDYLETLSVVSCNFTGLIDRMYIFKRGNGKLHLGNLYNSSVYSCKIENAYSMLGSLSDSPKEYSKNVE